ncbi:Uncharacterized protein ChrSV_1533 [Chromobacterium vaccinii]|nr:Uncharacterized protein ChrSW_1533 [Chromobacterium vaccinii]QND88991.1 Uncharacterized protein ChrSV_1533 [Chromobacterium vaccinii]
MVEVKKVISVVVRALEVLTQAGEAKAVDHGRSASGWSDYSGNDLEAARAVQEALITMPAESYLALMWLIAKDNPQLGEPFLKDLTTFVAHSIPDGDRFGRSGLEYWVRHWAKRDGSSREAAFLFGKSFATHQRFYREQVDVRLNAWLTVAKGKVEEVIDVHYCDYRDAA